MTESSYRFVSGITVVISAISVLSSSYIIISWRRLTQLKQNDLLNDYVAFMSIFDLLLVLLRGIFVSNPAFKWTFISETSTMLCRFIGGFHQLSAICATTCNFVIAAFILLPTIKQTSMYQISTFRKYHYIFIAVVTIIIVLIPVMNNGYGLTDNNASKYGLSEYECWIQNEDDYISLYGPVTFYLLFSILLLIYSILLIYFEKNENASQLIPQLIWYTTVFVCVWTPAIINRYYNWITKSSLFFLTCFEMICLHSDGWANAIVWYTYMKPQVTDSSALKALTHVLVDKTPEISLEINHK